ncbi:MAG UNVERIFIED_CONTAM: AIPR family protein [Planctomycetaceae bacterium]
MHEGIRNTLLSDESENFYFFNSGLTLICDSFRYNALQSSDYEVRAENLRIVHGSQICTTIADTLSKLPDLPNERLRHASVLVRICELPSAHQETIRQITQNANWLSPGALRDLHSNDHIQLRLQKELDALGYSYRRQRHDSMPGPLDVTSREAATAILAVCRRLPHRAADVSGGVLSNTLFIDFQAVSEWSGTGYCGAAVPPCQKPPRSPNPQRPGTEPLRIRIHRHADG